MSISLDPEVIYIMVNYHCCGGVEGYLAKRSKHAHCVVATGGFRRRHHEGHLAAAWRCGIAQQPRRASRRGRRPVHPTVRGSVPVPTTGAFTRLAEPAPSGPNMPKWLLLGAVGRAPEDHDSFAEGRIGVCLCPHVRSLDRPTGQRHAQLPRMPAGGEPCARGRLGRLTRQVTRAIIAKWGIVHMSPNTRY
jgi:hypothetical protein